jgi:hypothetical protein
LEIPLIEFPDPIPIKTISIPLPTADVPSYVPLVLPPSDLDAVEPPKGSASEEKQEVKPPVPPSIKLPVVDIDVPLPTTAVVMAATYAAVSAVAVTTLAQPFFDTIKKQIQKLMLGKINKWKEQRKNKKKKDSLEK